MSCLYTYFRAVALTLFAVILSALLLGCGSKEEIVDMDYLCSPQGNITGICGFKRPEDMEWLPDGSGMIVSEYGNLGSLEGRLSLYNPDSGKIELLYDSQISTKTHSQQIWGEADCLESEFFSPHGISLTQRSDGKWQLLAVNHSKSENIDFFELVNDNNRWKLNWRGCVTANDDSFFNDVAATQDGFFVTRFFAAGSPINSLLDYYLNRKNGFVKKWSQTNGWKTLEGTTGVALNGVLWNQANNELVVAEWGNAKLNVFDGEGSLKYSVAMPFPDNVSWNADKTKYLVPSKQGSMLSTIMCSSQQPEVCESPFTVYEISPISGEKQALFYHDGSFFGATSNALESDGKLFLGSFIGSRMLVVDLVR